MMASVVRLFTLHYIGWNNTLLGADFNKLGRIFWSEATQRFLLQHFSRKTRAALQIYSCRNWIAVLFVQNSWWKRRDAECALVSSNLITFIRSCVVLAKILHIPFFIREEVFPLMCLLQSWTRIYISHDAKKLKCWCANCRFFCRTNRWSRHSEQNLALYHTYANMHTVALLTQFSLKNVLFLKAFPHSVL